MTKEERRRYEELQRELEEITLTCDKDYSAERVAEIVQEMETLNPAEEGGISEAKYLASLRDMFTQEMEEDDELLLDYD